MDLTLAPKPTPWLPWLLLTIFAFDVVSVFSFESSLLPEGELASVGTTLAYGLPFLLLNAVLLIAAWNVIRRSVTLSEGRLQVRVPLLGARAVRSISLATLSKATIDAYSVSITWLEYTTLALEPRAPAVGLKRIFLPMGRGKRDPEVLTFVEALNKGIGRAGGEMAK